MLTNIKNNQNIQIIDLRAEYERHEEEKGISTNIDMIDKLTGGIFPGLTVMCGFTSHGKSLWANTIAYKCVCTGVNVLYVTLEIPTVDILYQMVSIDSLMNEYSNPHNNPISHTKFKTKSLSEEEKNYAFDIVYPRFLSYPGELYIASELEFNYNSIDSFKDKLKEINDLAKSKNGKDIGLIIIDQLQLFKGVDGMKLNAPKDIISYWTNEIRKISVNYLDSGEAVPVLLLSQINREGFKAVGLSKNDRGDKNYNLTNLSESSEIERAANTVLCVFSDPSLKMSDQALYSVIKCRNGKTSENFFLNFMNREYYYAGRQNVPESVTNCSLEDILNYNPFYDSKNIVLEQALDKITMEDEE